MKEQNKLGTKLRTMFEFLQNKKTRKRVSITYQVVWNIILIFLIVTLIGSAFASGVGAGYFAALVKDEPIRTYENMKKDIYNYEETSELYFANDVFLGKLRSDLEREEITIDEMSEDLIHAVIATEDEYFHEHNGVVPKAILRAIFQEVSNSSVQTGGSTLTQQLIKMQILTNEVSFDRKAKEILLALRLEKFFKKEQILEAYLNVSPFGRNSSGRNIAGVQSAAKGLFGISAADLNLPQAAFIAGLPQSPFGYTPFTNDGTIKNNLEPGLTRMKTVLKRMYDNGYISKKDYNYALQYDVTNDFIAAKKSPQQKYPWLTFEIEKRSIQILADILAERDGYEKQDLQKNDDLRNEYLILADKNLRQNGYKIYTTINKDIYDKMQKVKNQFPYYGSDRQETVKDPETGENKVVPEPVELGAVLIENQTGKIISFVGGRDHSREQINHATSAKRPNGSTMKPLLVYAPAMELGKASPGTIIPDIEMQIRAGGQVWSPKNYDGRYSGLTSARYALTKSYNIPAAKVYLDIIDQRPAQYLEKMGFSSLTEGDYYNPSLALGALTNGVTVEENVNAFSTFANDGKFIDAYLIEKIVDQNGKTIFKHQSKPVNVFSPQTAYLTIDMMRDVINKGTATAMNGRLKFNADWAGKTGTGQDYKDAWFVATNPNVTFGVWTGYDTPKPLEVRYKGLTYGVRNIYLWADLMNVAYDVSPKLVAPSERFKMPGGIVRRSYCAISGLLPSDACLRAGLVETDYFNAKFVPSKVDDSLVNGKYVTIGDKKYLALDSTPAEFAKQGLMLNPDYIKKIGGNYFKNPRQLIPEKDRWANILVPEDRINDNGKVPASLSVKLSNQTIVWSRHSENDIIGYRVYKRTNKAIQKIASISAGSSLSFSASNGEYYISAVDIAGKESAPSNIVSIGTKPDETKKPDSKEPSDGEPSDDETPGEKPSDGSTPEQPEEQNNQTEE